MVIIRLPGSGLFTVNVPVTVTLPPTGMFPVHASPVRAQRQGPGGGDLVAVGDGVVDDVGARRG